jgi:transposase InsO family protein
VFIDSPEFNDIPEDKLEILRHFHRINRHQGITRTLESLKKAGNYWPTMRLDTIRFVQSCPICQLTWRIPRAAHIQRDTFESYDPFYYITLDFMGPYPVDTQGNAYFLCITDVFTRYIEIFATPDATAETASLCLLRIYSRYTLPRIIEACIAPDNGPAFISKAFQGLLQLIGAKPSYSLPYRHQTSAERPNEEVLRYTRVLLLERKDDKLLTMDTRAGLTMKIVNTSVHTDTNCAPHEMLMGIY